MQEFLKIRVGQEFWLVPIQIASPDFREAVNKFNRAADGETILLSNDEARAFSFVREHPYTWRPFIFLTAAALKP